MLIAHGDIHFIRRAGPKIYFALRSPLTNEWSNFEALEKEIVENNFSGKIQDFVTYYQDLQHIVKNARNYHALNYELTALDEEEIRIFGLRRPYSLSAYRRI